MQQFFVVWNPAGSNPVHRHRTAELATQEARRLAEVSRGQTFYVLAAVSVSTFDAVKTEQLDTAPEIPF